MNKKELLENCTGAPAPGPRMQGMVGRPPMIGRGMRAPPGLGRPPMGVPMGVPMAPMGVPMAPMGVPMAPMAPMASTPFQAGIGEGPPNNPPSPPTPQSLRGGAGDPGSPDVGKETRMVQMGVQDDPEGLIPILLHPHGTVAQDKVENIMESTPPLPPEDEDEEEVVSAVSAVSAVGRREGDDGGNDNKNAPIKVTQDEIKEQLSPVKEALPDVLLQEMEVKTSITIDELQKKEEEQYIYIIYIYIY